MEAGQNATHHVGVSHKVVGDDEAEEPPLGRDHERHEDHVERKTVRAAGSEHLKKTRI